MKKIFLTMYLLLACASFAIESEVQFENDQIRASKVKILAHEEIALHRDDYPQVITALKGGTITRIEADGSETEVKFPKGEAIFREADPIGQFHKSVNKTCKPIELIVVELKNGTDLKK